MTTKAERIAYLRRLGWVRTSAAGSQSWRNPDQETGAYTLAAAYEHATRNAQPDGTVPAIKIGAPLVDWTRPHSCQLWRDLTAEYGPLMSIRITGGSRWNRLDDLAREVIGAEQDRVDPQTGQWRPVPLQERDLYLGWNGWTIIRAAHLDRLVAAFAEARSLDYLKVRAVPDSANCAHKRCWPRQHEATRVRLET